MRREPVCFSTKFLGPFYRFHLVGGRYLTRNLAAVHVCSHGGGGGGGGGDV